MRTDTNQHNGNHRIDNRRYVRRRRAEIAGPEPREEERHQHEQKQKPKQIQQHEVRCLPEILDVSFSDSSEASDLLQLPPLLSAVGHDYCAGETIFRFQHFQYDGVDITSSDLMGSTSATATEETESKSSSSLLSSSTLPAAFPLQQQHRGWYVNCCDSPQLHTNGDLDDLLESNLGGQYRPTNIFRDLQDNSVNLGENQTETVDRSGKIAIACTVFVSTVASILSLVMILAITLPLLKKRKRTRASTYNLYLVFLAIPDLLYNVFLAYMFGTFDKWTIDATKPSNGLFPLPIIDHPWDLALFACCASTSLYLNAVIAYELLKLLRNSKRRKRSKAPTLKQATIKSLLVYMIGTFVFVLDHVFADRLNEALPLWGVWLITIPLTVGIPITYLLWVCFRIWWEQLVGDANSKAGKRLRILVKYFTRIIFVYVGLWVPAVALYLGRYGSNGNEGLFYYVACILYAIQVWIGFAMSLTKPDVRKMVVGLFTCKNCRDLTDESRPKKSIFSKKGSADKKDVPEPREKQPTHSTGDDSESYVIEIEIEGNPDPCTPADSTLHGSSDTLSIDDNVFDFDGKDAPVERQRGEGNGRRLSLALGFRKMLRRQSSVSRSSGIFNTSRRYNTQQIPQHSESFRGSRGGATNKFLDGSVSRLGSVSEPLFLEPEFAEAYAKMLESKRKSTGEMPHDSSSDSDKSGSVKSFSEATAESTRSATMKFFMDSNDSNKDLVTSYMDSPKKRRKWMKELRKNIRDLRRRLKTQKLTETERSIYRQSMWHQQKALEVAASIDSLGRMSGISRISGISGITIGDRSSGASTIGNVRDSRIPTFENIDRIPSSSRRSSLSSTFRSVSSSDEDGEDHSEDFHMLGGNSNQFKIERETAYTQNNWATDLRNNIVDLSSRLENETISSNEKMMVSRAIKSQRMTLCSIEGLDDITRTMLFGQSPSSRAMLFGESPSDSPMNSPMVSPRHLHRKTPDDFPDPPTESSGAGMSPNVVQRKNSAFMQSPLEVIQDDSDEMAGEDEEEKEASQRQRTSKTLGDLSMFNDETGRTERKV